VSSIDYAIIVLYFVIVIGMGFYYYKRASQDLDAYFLGGKKIHWMWLAMSGSVSNFDITGTMWIVSMLFLLGMRSMWIHWMWGWMMGAFFLAYMARWIRRSDVMTGAEWMITRFGEDRGGKAARMAAAIVAVVATCGMIGYAFQGIGKFAAQFVPGVEPNTLAFAVIGTTTVYVMIGGLFSVVVTDMIQTVLVTMAAIIIGAVAYVKLSPEAIHAALPADWLSLMPTWRLEGLADAAQSYQLFGALVIVWVAKGLLANAGGPVGTYEMQRFLAARDARDAAKIGAMWSVFIVARWGMCMGIVLLAIVAMEVPGDSETIMPRIISEYMPVGIKGLVLAGLLAAFMSTFSSTVNGGAAYLIRDFWQPYFRPKSEECQLVRASYFATILLVVVGVIIGFQAKSIAAIWEWLMTALGACMILPNVMRWYWWRLNGWGYAAGTIAGLIAALIHPVMNLAAESTLFLQLPEGLQTFLDPAAPMYVVFPFVTAVSLVACVTVTLLTRPTEDPILRAFYTKVRPFGMWAHIREECGLHKEQVGMSKESPGLAVLNTLLGIVAITSAYLFPMYLVGHWHGRAGLCFSIAAVAVTCLYFTWYRTLPAADED
jgi:solute:Na+ symporter, SSS family